MNSLFGRRLRRALIVALLPALTVGVLSAAPVQAQRIKPDFWGMHDRDWSAAPGVTVGAANLTTSGTYWRSVQPRKREFNWARLSAQVAGAEAAGAQPMVVLGQTPRHASTCRHSASYQTCMPRIRPWRKYVSKVASRFGSRLDYQIWPEPNIVQNWRGTPRQMARLTMVASKAIGRHAGPRAKVVSPAVAVRLKGQRSWMTDYFRQRFDGVPVHTYVDAVAIDPFPEQRGTPEDSWRLMRVVRQELRRIGVRKPLWSNEINYGVAGGGEPTDTTYSVRKQQSFVVRTYVLSAAAGMRRTYWLGWFATDTMAVRLVDQEGEALRPARSYATVRSWLNRGSFRGLKRWDNGVWVATVRRGPDAVRRVYWKPGGRATITTPRSTRRVENQSGKVITRGPGRVRVTSRPIMVASRR